MGTMIYHENFKQLMIAECSYATTTSYFYPKIKKATGERFTDANGSFWTELYGSAISNNGHNTAEGTAIAGNIIRECVLFKQGMYGNVYTPVGTQTTQKQITIGTAPASWVGLNNTPNRISPELYAITGAATGVNSGIRTLTITNNSASTIRFDYIAAFTNLYTNTGGGQSSFLLWIYQFDEAVELPAGGGITLGFSPWGEVTTS